MKVRNYKIKFNNTKENKHWYGNDPFVTHFLNALSFTFPEGESFFKRAIKCHTTDELKDLEQEIKIFLAQESFHTTVHNNFNKFVSNYGYNVKVCEKITEIFLQGLEKYTNKQMCLAVTCALEHMTALLAEIVLTNLNINKNIKDPDILKLWRWHAIEEIEHKSIAFNIYERTYGSGFQAYLYRVLAQIVATSAIVSGVTIFQTILLNKDNKNNLKTWATGLYRLWYNPGCLASILKKYFTYYQFNFHPDIHDTSHLLHIKV